MIRIAALDLGTNSFHLCIVDVNEKSGELSDRRLYKKRVYLGKDNDGSITKEGWKRSVEAIEKFEKEIYLYTPRIIHGVGTEVFRSSDNGRALMDEFIGRTGWDLNIIDGDEEARTIYPGLADDVHDRTDILVDSGGGGTEVSHGTDNDRYWSTSIPYGCQNLYNSYVTSDPIRQTDINRITKELRPIIEILVYEKKRYPFSHIYGTSGTFTAIKRSTNDDGVWPDQTDINYIWATCEKLITSTCMQRGEIMTNSSENRCKIIPAGCVIVKELIQRLDIKEVTIGKGGLLDGVIVDMIQKQVRVVSA